MKWFVILVILIFFSGIAFSLSPIRVEREILNQANQGETVQIKLNINFIGEKPNGFIVTEYIPDEWVFEESIPNATKFENKVSWLFYGENVKNTEIIYELKTPQSIKEMTPIFGEWQTVSAKGIISGETGIKKAVKQTAAHVEVPGDNTLLYILIIVIVIVIVVGLVGEIAFKKKKKVISSAKTNVVNAKKEKK